MAHFARGWVLLLAGDPARAKPELEKSLALDPTAALTHALLGQQAEAAGDNAAALVHYEAGLTKVTNNTLLLAHVVRAKGLLGRSDEARAALHDLTERGRRGYVRAYLFAVAYSGLGETEPALDALERAVAEHDPAVATLRLTQMFDSLRSQPRFQAIEAGVEAKLWSSRLKR
jgi:Tfp pilus assembly protein PilF